MPVLHRITSPGDERRFLGDLLFVCHGRLAEQIEVGLRGRRRKVHFSNPLTTIHRADKYKLSEAQ